MPKAKKKAAEPEPEEPSIAEVLRIIERPAPEMVGADTPSPAPPPAPPGTRAYRNAQEAADG